MQKIQGYNEHIESLEQSIYYLAMYTKEMKYEMGQKCYPRAKMFLELQRSALEEMQKTLNEIISEEQQHECTES